MAVTGPVYNHEKTEYYGLAGDTKPTGVPKGSRYIEFNADDSATKIYFTPDGTNWHLLTQTV